jgi:hypothetical protein
MVEIDLPLSDVTDKLVEGLLEVCKQYPGSSRTRICVLDRTTQYRVPLISKVLRIDASNEFISAVEGHGDVAVRLIAN